MSFTSSYLSRLDNMVKFIINWTSYSKLLVRILDENYDKNDLII